MKSSKKLLLTALVLAASSSLAFAEQSWRELESHLEELMSEAVLSSEGEKLVQHMSVMDDVFRDRKLRLREYGIFTSPTVRFDERGHSQAAVIGGAGSLVVAEQVHGNRLAFAKSLFNVSRYVQEHQWKNMTEEEKALLKTWQALPEKRRKELDKEHFNIRTLAWRSTGQMIEELTKQLQEDKENVDLLIKRGKLYMECGDAYAYTAWTDLAKAVAMAPKHANIAETVALAENLRAALR